MMEVQEALNIVQQILAPRQLSYIEELVFSHTWNEKLYREMALDTGYEEGYLKDTGSHLWHLLSEKLGYPVTKKRLRLILADVFALENPIAYAPAQGSDAVAMLEFPGSPLACGSPLYIERSPIEDLAVATLHQPGGLVRIKAPQRMGKTSLINHVMGVAHQAGIKTVFVDFRQADANALGDVDQFLRWFSWAIGQQLTLGCNFDAYWFDSAGSKLSCTTHLQEHVLSQVEGPIVVAIDTVHHLVHYPHIAQNFFSMLRSWYEQAKVREDWQKLRLMMAYVAELDLPLQINQSPFNVGLPLDLPHFTPAQVSDLVERYDLHTLGLGDVGTLQPLLNLVGGHPYLLQLAFYWLRSGHLTLAQLLQDAASNHGIFREELHRLWRALQRDDTLMDAFYQVVLAAEPIDLNPKVAEELEGLGLVELEGVKASLRCELFRQYFGLRLGGHHG